MTFARISTGSLRSHSFIISISDDKVAQAPPKHRDLIGLNEMTLRDLCRKNAWMIEIVK